jgi:predicted enzyme related to lactoylglutathione lyase
MTFMGIATAGTSDFPSLVQPANSEHHVGKVIWADLITTDVESAKRFYGGLFGWTFRDIVTGQNSSYTVALVDDQPVAGLISHDVPAGEHRQPAWLTFMAVRDVNAVKRVALAHGAKLLVEPRNYPQRGQQAVFADPQGAVFAVLASRSGDPADDEVSPGEWIWSSLMTRDADTDAAFYQSIFGYEVFELTSDGDHLVLSSDNFARASVNTLSGNNPNRHPHWLNFVRVANVDAASAKVTELGGRVLVEPHVDRHGGRVAVVADPAGAPFGIMEWSDNDSMELAK